MGGIVVIGSLNMDLVVKTERMPAPGETVRGQGLQTIPGGKGANQAAAIVLMGGTVAMIGRVGGDAFGPRLIENLAEKGVKTSRILQASDAATGIAMILVDAHGQNSIVIAAGANGQVSPQDIDACDPLLRQSDYLVLQFEIPLETVAYAIEKAARYGLKVVLNPAPAMAFSRELLKGIQYLVPNESEAQLLTGLPVVDAPSAERAARLLKSQGADTVIITLGEKGVLAVNDAETLHAPALKVNAVDTTAAGDAFIGGLVVALSHGLALKEALRYANCAGAIAVTRFGAQTSLPSAVEVQALYEQNR
jgi:ribokinase